MYVYAVCSSKEQHYTEVRRGEWVVTEEGKSPTPCPAHPSKGLCRAERAVHDKEAELVRLVCGEKAPVGDECHCTGCHRSFANDRGFLRHLPRCKCQTCRASGLETPAAAKRGGGAAEKAPSWPDMAQNYRNPTRGFRLV